MNRPTEALPIARRLLLPALLLAASLSSINLAAHAFPFRHAVKETEDGKAADAAERIRAEAAVGATQSSTLPTTATSTTPSASTLTSTTPMPAQAPSVDTKNKELDFVSCKILINAPVDVVWKTVHVERDSAPDLVSNTLLEGSDNHSKFEQKWTVIPFISTSTCIIDEIDVPMSRIDYKLLTSDHFKVMQGSWVFEPAEDGKATVLELNARLELRRHGPKPFLNIIAKRKMSRRLAHVKELAEETRSEMKVDAKVL